MSEPTTKEERASWLRLDYQPRTAFPRLCADIDRLESTVVTLTEERDRAVEAVHTHVREGAEMCRRHEAELAAARQQARVEALEECIDIADGAYIDGESAQRVAIKIRALATPPAAAPVPEEKP